jgi:pyrroloquinoline quinone (PQQ) biosynthesis protein C
MLAAALQREIEACAVRLHGHPLLLAAKRGEVPPLTVTKYLRSVLHLVRHTPLHLELARVSAASHGRHELARYFRHKAGEEHGHDRWADSDLHEMRLRFGDAVDVTLEPCHAIAQLVAELGRTIPSAPAAYIAYILFAEYITVLMGPIWVSALQEHCGVPAGALTVVARHAELDRDHVAECVPVLETLLAASDAPRAFQTLSFAMRQFEAFCDELFALSGASRAA